MPDTSVVRGDLEAGDGQVLGAKKRAKVADALARFGCWDFTLESFFTAAAAPSLERDVDQRSLFFHSRPDEWFFEILHGFSPTRCLTT